MTNRKPYETETLSLVADDGSTVEVVVPTSLPSNERAEQLRALWDQFVTYVTPGDWKGAVVANHVPAALVADVSEAMIFMGAIVDLVADPIPCDPRIPREFWGTRTIYSEGYRAHGF